MNAWSFKEKYHQKIRRKLSKKLSFPVPKYSMNLQRIQGVKVKNIHTFKSTLLQGPKDPVLPTLLYTLILGASNELKEIVIESGHQAETLFERVNDGYAELTVSKYKVDKLDTKLINIKWQKKGKGKIAIFQKCNILL